MQVERSRDYRGQSDGGSYSLAGVDTAKVQCLEFMGYLKGKSAVRIHRELLRTQGTLFGRAFWSRGYCVSTVGLDEAMIKRYIQDQEKDERDDERGLFDLLECLRVKQI